MDSLLGFHIESIYIGVSIFLFCWKSLPILIIHSKSFCVLSLYVGLCLCLYIFCGVNVIKD